MIDFSSKHNILLRNPDGTFSPMDEPYFRAESIAPHTWQITSSGDYSYLLSGEKEAISVDTGYGAGNLRAFLQTLTDVPVKNTFNTHSHFDHSANNSYFEKTFMAPAGFSRATVPYASFDGIDFPRDYRKVAVSEGFVYDLGSRTLEVFDIPDHTPDGIALLDRKERLLITGDEFMRIGKVLQVSVAVFFGYTEKLMAHRGEFDRLLAGAGVLNASLLDDYHTCAEKILAGDLGEPEQMKGPFGPPPMPPGPHGETVYDRILPHFGDGGAGKALPPGEYYTQHQGAIHITYRADNIR